MRKTIKAVLLSALVFPGVGYFTLGFKRRGLVCVGLALLCFIYIARFIFNWAIDIQTSVLETGILPDPIAMSAELSQKLYGLGSGPVNIAVLLLVLIWLWSIVDALRLGRRTEKGGQ